MPRRKKAEPPEPPDGGKLSRAEEEGFNYVPHPGTHEIGLKPNRRSWSWQKSS